LLKTQISPLRLTMCAPGGGTIGFTQVIEQPRGKGVEFRGVKAGELKIQSVGRKKFAQALKFVGERRPFIGRVFGNLVIEQKVGSLSCLREPYQYDTGHLFDPDLDRGKSDGLSRQNEGVLVDKNRYCGSDVADPFAQQGYLLGRVDADVIGMALQVARIAIFVSALDSHGKLLV